MFQAKEGRNVAQKTRCVYFHQGTITSPAYDKINGDR